MDEAVFLHPPVPDGFNVKAPGGGKKYKGWASPAPTIHDGRGTFRRIVGASLAGVLKDKGYIHAKSTPTRETWRIDCGRT